MEIALTAALVFGAGCSGEQVREPSTVQDTVVSTAEPQAPRRHIQPFTEGLELFTDSFNCPVDVTISEGEIPNDDFSGVDSNYSIAVSNKAGSIIVNSQLPLAYDLMVEHSEIDPIRIGVHESTHACQVDTQTPLKSPLEIPSQGMSFVAVRGLTLITDQKTADGNDYTKFSNIEEGAAEVAATELRGGVSPNPDYAKYEEITRTLMANSSMTVDELIAYVQNNDIYGFLSHVSGIAEPTNEDLIDLIDLYNF